MQDLKISITPAADKFVRRMIRFDGGPGSGLRLSVAPGGCSGLSAEFTVAPQPAANETVYEINGLKFFIGTESRILLQDVTMDFVETPTSSGFKFHDPKSVSSCGSHNHGAPSVHEHDHAHEH